MKVHRETRHRFTTKRRVGAVGNRDRFRILAQSQCFFSFFLLFFCFLMGPPLHFSSGQNARRLCWKWNRCKSWDFAGTVLLCITCCSCLWLCNNLYPGRMSVLYPFQHSHNKWQGWQSLTRVFKSLLKVFITVLIYNKVPNVRASSRITLGATFTKEEGVTAVGDFVPANGGVFLLPLHFCALQKSIASKYLQQNSVFWGGNAVHNSLRAKMGICGKK